MPVEVEEGVSGLREETIPEDEVQIIPLPTPTQQTHAFIKNLQDSAPYYVST